MVGTGLLGLAGGLASASLPLAAVGLLLVGLGNGVWDVAVNVEGVDVERRSGASLLPRLHAVFSVGTVVGAGVGAGCSAAGVAMSVQLPVMAVGVTVVLAFAARGFVAERRRSADTSGGSGLLRAWREPRTVLIGFVVLGFAFTEGAANDWLAIAFVDGLGVDATGGALAYGTFVTAVMLGRVGGGWALDRFSRAAVLRVSAVVALVGLCLVLVGGPLAVAFLGALLWGLGSALGFPVGISSAGDGDGARAAARVSVVSSLGYTAFIAGPPVLGVLSGEVGILNALLLVPVALVVSFVAAGALRRPATSVQGE